MAELDKLKGEINSPTPVKELTEAQISQLQEALAELGYYTGNIDGIYGDKTRRAWAQFKDDEWMQQSDTIGTGSLGRLAEKVRHDNKKLIPTLEENPSVDELKESLILEASHQGLEKPAQHAYMMATIEHETAGTFEPVREAYWMSEGWRRRNLRYYPYYGRGYVQLTWKSNYLKYAQITHKPLVDNPDLVMEADTALFILVHGFANGTFTGHSIDQFINERKVDYFNARKCINGLDKADDIADLARKWRHKL